MAQYKSLGNIDNIVAGSPAEKVGVLAGDKLLRINGQPIKDVVGYQFHQVASRVALEVERDGQAAPLVFTLRKPEQQDLGLEFFDPTFDGIKRCNNHCPFCFVDQNAPGLRRSLDIKDDDYRYSFLYGGFVTLTNLKEDDWRRIGEERLTPLYVSVHATEPAVRRALLGNPRAPEIIPQLARLGEMGIQIHTQLVLCPSVNDGEHLDRSIEELALLYPHVRTVGVVPVGLTRFRRNSHYQIKLGIRPYVPTEAEPLIEQVEQWQKRLRKSLGVNFAYLSDEWYIMAGREVPRARDYESFPQLENGIGLARRLLDEAGRTARRLPSKIDRPVTLAVVCGEMPEQTLERALLPLREVENLGIELITVKNTTLGGNVGCSGLLFGAEAAQAIRQTASGSRFDLVFLPRRMFDFSGVRTLDEWTVHKFQQELGLPVIQAEWTRQIWDGVHRLLRGENCFVPPTQVERFSQLG